jgi:hypothetical protein
LIVQTPKGRENSATTAEVQGEIRNDYHKEAAFLDDLIEAAILAIACEFSSAVPY